MVKKWIIALISLTLVSTGYYAADNKDSSEQESGKDNKGQKKSAEVNKGKQGKKMREEHANEHAKNPDDAKNEGKNHGGDHMNHMEHSGHK
ncbi:MAG: hypothetical protein OEV66_08035 [Spirochaetia bacterium]|nr:hypothetical protein [Spirochaetia bacterium]